MYSAMVDGVKVFHNIFNIAQNCTKYNLSYFVPFSPDLKMGTSLSKLSVCIKIFFKKHINSAVVESQWLFKTYQMLYKTERNFVSLSVFLPLDLRKCTSLSMLSAQIWTFKKSPLSPQQQVVSWLYKTYQTLYKTVRNFVFLLVPLSLDLTMCTSLSKLSAHVRIF